MSGEHSLSIIISFWPRWVLEAFALNFIYINICKITISKKQIHMRTKGVFCMSVKLCVWTSGSHQDMMAQLLSRYRDQSLKKYFSPRPLFLSCFGTPAEGRTLSWSSSVLNERAFGVSLFLVYVFSRTLSCLSSVGDWTLMSISWLCFRHVWSGLLSSVLSLHVMCGLIRRPPDWISFVLSLWFWRNFKLWVPLHRFPLGLFTCFWLVVSDPLWCFLCSLLLICDL